MYKIAVAQLIACLVLSGCNASQVLQTDSVSTETFTSDSTFVSTANDPESTTEIEEIMEVPAQKIPIYDLTSRLDTSDSVGGDDCAKQYITVHESGLFFEERKIPEQYTLIDSDESVTLCSQIMESGLRRYVVLDNWENMEVIASKDFPADVQVQLLSNGLIHVDIPQGTDVHHRTPQKYVLYDHLFHEYPFQLDFEYGVAEVDYGGGDLWQHSKYNLGGLCFNPYTNQYLMLYRVNRDVVQNAGLWNQFYVGIFDTLGNKVKTVSLLGRPYMTTLAQMIPLSDHELLLKVDELKVGEENFNYAYVNLSKEETVGQPYTNIRYVNAKHRIVITDPLIHPDKKDYRIVYQIDEEGRAEELYQIDFLDAYIDDFDRNDKNRSDFYYFWKMLDDGQRVLCKWDITNLDTKTACTEVLKIKACSEPGKEYKSCDLKIELVTAEGTVWLLHEHR